MIPNQALGTRGRAPHAERRSAQVYFPPPPPFFFLAVVAVSPSVPVTELPTPRGSASRPPRLRAAPYLVGVLAALQVHDALAPALRVAQHVVLRVLQEGRGARGGERGGGQPAGLQVQRAVRPQPAALRVRRGRLGAALRLLALLGGDGEARDDGRQHAVGGPAAPLRRVGQLPGGGGGDGGAARLEEGAQLPHAEPRGPAEVRAVVQRRSGLRAGVGGGRPAGRAPGPAAGGVHEGAPRRASRETSFVAQPPAAARSPAARLMSSPPSPGGSDSPAARYRARCPSARAMGAHRALPPAAAAAAAPLRLGAEGRSEPSPAAGSPGPPAPSLLPPPPFCFRFSSGGLRFPGAASPPAFPPLPQHEAPLAPTAAASRPPPANGRLLLGHGDCAARASPGPSPLPGAGGFDLPPEA